MFTLSAKEKKRRVRYHAFAWTQLEHSNDSPLLCRFYTRSTHMLKIPYLGEDSVSRKVKSYKYPSLDCSVTAN